MTPTQNLARAKQIDQLAQKEYQNADNHWLTAITKYAQAKKQYENYPNITNKKKLHLATRKKQQALDEREYAINNAYEIRQNLLKAEKENQWNIHTRDS